MNMRDQLARLTRGAAQVISEAELAEKLRANRPLRVKLGVDPTSADLHLGHTIILRKLRDFQELGHQAVLIIGDYTALIGDPSGRDKSRTSLTQEQVNANAKDYLQQVGKIIDISKSEVRYNGEWFSRFSFLEVKNLAAQITVQRMLERDDFTKRYKEGTP